MSHNITDPELRLDPVTLKYGEFWPMLTDPVVVVQKPLVDQEGKDEGGQGFCGAEDVLDRVAIVGIVKVSGK